MLILLSTVFSLAVSVIPVRDQTSFDRFPDRVRSAISSGATEVRVQMDRGCYTFREDHFRLDDIHAPACTIVIDGGGATLLGAGPDFTLAGGRARYADPYSPAYGYYSYDDGTVLTAAGPVRKAGSPVEPVLSQPGLFRIKTGGADAGKPDSHIVISTWYTAYRCAVKEVRNGYTYFLSDRSLRDLNGDVIYAQALPRYLLFNPVEGSSVRVRDGYIHAAAPRLHECRTSRFLTVWGGELGRLEVRNVDFAGNGGDDYLMQLHFAAIGSTEIHHCTFRGIQDRVLSCHQVHDCSFHDNVVEDICHDGVVFDMLSERATVSRNLFRNIGTGFRNAMALTVLGKDFTVVSNRFVDVNYAAVNTGVPYSCDLESKCSGVIEKNEICQSDGFDRTLMDAGAIYVGTMNAGLVIRNNYIHDIRSGRDYRGIFGDDGAYGVTVSGNLILDTPTSYSIDFRRVASVETRADSYAKRVNVNNRISGNTVDGKVRFEPRGGEDGCYKGKDRVLKTDAERRSAVARWRRKYGRNLPQ